MPVRGLPGAAGFSLLELVVVLAMAMVASAIAVPIMVRMVADSQLHRGMGDLSGLYQTGRMLAVRGNTITRVRFQLSGNNWVAYVDDGTSAHGLNSTTPQLCAAKANFSKVAAPTGTAPSPLDAASCGSTITPDTTDDTYFNQTGHSVPLQRRELHQQLVVRVLLHLFRRRTEHDLGGDVRVAGGPDESLVLERQRVDELAP